jgi:hypothetical protein
MFYIISGFLNKVNVLHEKILVKKSEEGGKYK